MSDPFVLELVDLHAGGDVSRVVTGGVAPIPGATVFDKMRHLETEADGLRRVLLAEPYGHPWMCVNLVVEPSLPEAEAGYVIMEAMGYPSYSGSNTICTAAALLERRRGPLDDGEHEIRLESPAGLVHAHARSVGGRVTEVTAEGQPAFVTARGETVSVPGHGVVRFDLAWSGDFYAVVDAESLGLSLDRSGIDALAAFGDAFMRTARHDLSLEHPELGPADRLGFVCFAGPLEGGPGSRRARAATYVHPGVICRSPTGTGTSARMALLVADGELAIGDALETTSPYGNRFVGRALEASRVGGHAALRSTITARPWTVARSRVVLHPERLGVEPGSLLPILERS